MSLNVSQQKKSGVNQHPSLHVTRCLETCAQYPCLRSPLVCAGLFDLNKNTVHHVPHISTVVTCSWPRSLLFLPSVYCTTSFSFPSLINFQARSAPGSNFYWFFSLLWARAAPDAIQLPSITLINELYRVRTLKTQVDEIRNSAKGLLLTVSVNVSDHIQ